MIEGKTIAITRAEDDSQEFIDLITKEKGNAIPLPTIELVSKGEKIVDEFLSALEKDDPDYSVFIKLNAVGKKVIVPRSGASTPFLKELLEKIGLHVMELYLYDVCAFRDTSQWNEFRQLFSGNKVDGIIFTSASSVRAFFEIMQKDYEQNKLVDMLEKIMVISIGPFTADELKKLNVKNVIADVHTISGSFDALVKALSLAKAI